MTGATICNRLATRSQPRGQSIADGEDTQAGHSCLLTAYGRPAAAGQHRNTATAAQRETRRNGQARHNETTALLFYNHTRVTDNI